MGKNRGKSLEERFWSYVIKGSKPSDCWSWSASTTKDGYGSLGDGRGGLIKAPRVSWEIHHGAVKSGMQINHLCDNPACANPDHLYMGTQQDNIRDMVERGRQGNHKGTNNGRARIDELDVAAIRKLRSRGAAMSSIARSFGISNATVSHVCTKRTWAHVE